MATINLNLAHITAEQLVKDALNYVEGLTGNAPFAEVKPTMTAYGALIADAQAKITASDAANRAAVTATLAKEIAVAALHDGTVQLGGSVQSISQGNPALIASTNMKIKAAAAPVGKLPQVQNYSLTRGDLPGEVDSHWDATYGQSVYEHARCTSDPAVEANWSLIGTSSASKATHKGLPSGTRVWQRVRAKAKVSPEENDGGWSQPGTTIVP